MSVIIYSWFVIMELIFPKYFRGNYTISSSVVVYSMYPSIVSFPLLLRKRIHYSSCLTTLGKSMRPDKVAFLQETYTW